MGLWGWLQVVVAAGGSGWVGMGLGVKTPCGGCAGAACVVNAAGAVLCRCCGGGCGAHLGGVLGALRGSGLACPWVVLWCVGMVAEDALDGLYVPVVRR